MKQEETIRRVEAILSRDLTFFVVVGEVAEVEGFVGNLSLKAVCLVCLQTGL